MKTYTSTLLFVFFFLCSVSAYSLPKLNSFPSASATIYLDFDGHTVTSAAWNSGMPLSCISPGLSDAAITDIFNQVSEDYRPFNINITTDSTIFLAAPLIKRIRIIITPTSSWRPGVGGISYIGSFTWGDDTPAFVFSDKLGPNNPKYIAECCTHESGHAVGLSHQSSWDASCNLTETYNTGIGSGETGWAPVMGNSYYKNMTGWNDGPTPYGCALVQDNLSIITSTNGFGYRTDDYAESLNAGTYSLGGNSFSLDGIISTSTDKDAFKFTVTENSAFHFSAVPYSLGNNIGANLDIKIFIYNASQTLIRTYDPANTMSITIDTVLNSGTYYFVLDGTGNQYSTNYGSLGSYSVTGFFSLLPIHDVRLSGTVDKSKHNLTWNIIADEPIKKQEIQISSDGISFRALTSTAVTSKNFSYAPYDNNMLYYRLKVTSVREQSVYSNIVALKASDNSGKEYMVSTFVQNQVTVNASENYQYRLSDANGRLIAAGTGTKGFNNINVNNHPSGIYILQVFNDNGKQTERIIKQ